VVAGWRSPLGSIRRPRPLRHRWRPLSAQRLSGTGMRVTLVEPGMVNTPLWRRPPEAPLLEADDVARAVLYAVLQQAAVDVNEILRPVGQWHRRC
jgi:NADP-dependent 3-hydroxy acid dehydrogenase YdfG